MLVTLSMMILLGAPSGISKFDEIVINERFDVVYNIAGEDIENIERAWSLVLDRSVNDIEIEYHFVHVADSESFRIYTFHSSNSRPPSAALQAVRLAEVILDKATGEMLIGEFADWN